MAVLNAYDIGDCVRLSCTFATCSSTAGDPTTVALTIRDPDGVETEYTYAAGKVARSTTGSYYKDVTLSTAGTYYYRWVSTGVLTGALEWALRVRRSEIAG
jgi:hypothetical protein